MRAKKAPPDPTVTRQQVVHMMNNMDALLKRRFALQDELENIRLEYARLSVTVKKWFPQLAGHSDQYLPFILQGAGYGRADSLPVAAYVAAPVSVPAIPAEQPVSAATPATITVTAVTAEAVRPPVSTAKSAVKEKAPPKRKVPPARVKPQRKTTKWIRPHDD